MMDAATAAKLRIINNSFYRLHGASFSQTRQAPWAGWRRCLEYITALAGSGPLSVLDLACGNLRFASFLQDALPATPLAYFGVDDCDELLRPCGIEFQNLDLLHELENDVSLSESLNAPTCDLAVCFGFMHHVPTHAQRLAVLSALLDKTRIGGIAIVTFWRFMENASMAARAAADRAMALRDPCVRDIASKLDDADCLLGWQGIPGAWRYCHSFSDAETDGLLEAIADRATLLSQFLSDGRSDDLNCYAILRVK
jgi:SAM-dependent methyltransferase